MLEVGSMGATAEVISLGDVGCDFVFRLSPGSGADGVALVDSRGRVVARTGSGPDLAEVRLRVEGSRIGHDRTGLDPRAVWFSEGSGRWGAVEIAEPSRQLWSDFVRARMIPDASDVPTTTDVLENLLKEALSVPYVSRSVRDKISTGNGYQTIDLGSAVREGGRESRTRALAKFRWRGKSVVDLGANTGENSRILRRMGAAFVDGIEFDPYFVEIGRIANALTGASRVSLLQGDLTDSETYRGCKYDVVLALAVWVYVHDKLEAIAEVADVLVMETHTLDHGTAMYLDETLKYFPHGGLPRPDGPAARSPTESSNVCVCEGCICH